MSLDPQRPGGHTLSPSGIETTPVFRKASASGSAGCVELAPLADGGVAVRDSKNSDGPVLSFTRQEWTAFLDGLRRGEFDDLG
jgi:hypothetical protein